jgi:hypothetical protein
MNLNFDAATSTWKRITARHVALAGGLAIAASIAAGGIALPNTHGDTPAGSAPALRLQQAQPSQPVPVYHLVGSREQADLYNQAQSAVLQGMLLPASIAIPFVVESEAEAQRVLQAGMHAAMGGNGSPSFLVIDARP